MSSSIATTIVGSKGKRKQLNLDAEELFPPNTPPPTPVKETVKKEKKPREMTPKQKTVAFLKEKGEKYVVNRSFESLVSQYTKKYPDFFASLHLKNGVPNNLQDGEGLPNDFEPAYDDFDSAKTPKASVTQATKKEEEEGEDSESSSVSSEDESEQGNLKERVEQLEAKMDTLFAFFSRIGQYGKSKN